MSTSNGRYQVGATGRWTGKLEREDGARVGVDNITAATIWLRDGASGEDIRGSVGTPQTAFPSGTADFQFADGTDAESNLVTNIGWDVQAEDVALVNGALSREEHVAEILVAYDQSGTEKTLRHTHRLRCVDTPGICTWDDVLAALPDLNEEKARIQVEDMIEAFGALAEKRTLRRFRKTTALAPSTQVFSVSGYERTLQLARFPIDSVISVKQDLTGAFAGAAAEDAATYYVDAELGQITRRDVNWLKGVGCLQVVYAGGLFTDSASVDADLRWAAVQQVIHWWKFRDKLGIVSVSVPGSSVTQYSQKPLLPAVDDVLRLMRRPRRW